MNKKIFHLQNDYYILQKFSERGLFLHEPFCCVDSKPDFDLKKITDPDFYKIIKKGLRIGSDFLFIVNHRREQNVKDIAPKGVTVGLYLNNGQKIPADFLLDWNDRTAENPSGLSFRLE